MSDEHEINIPPVPKDHERFREKNGIARFLLQGGTWEACEDIVRWASTTYHGRQELWLAEEMCALAEALWNDEAFRVEEGRDESAAMNWKEWRWLRLSLAPKPTTEDAPKPRAIPKAGDAQAPPDSIEDRVAALEERVDSLEEEGE